MDDETLRCGENYRNDRRHSGTRHLPHVPPRAGGDRSGGLSIADFGISVTAERRAARRIAEEIALHHDREDLSKLGVTELLELRRSLFEPCDGLDEIGDVFIALLVTINAVTHRPYTLRDIAVFLLEHGPERCLHLLVRRGERLPIVAWTWVDRHRAWSPHRKSRLVRALADLLVQILVTPPKPVHLFYPRG